MLILVIGDLHIPQRKLALPEQLLRLLKAGKVHKVLATGNLCTPDQLAWLRSLCPDVVCVLGDADDGLQDARESTVQTIGPFKIGLIHGHQVLPRGDPERLAAVARELGVHILVSGATHAPSVATYEGVLFLNPGSATGAYAATGAHAPPAFMVLDARKDQLTVYQYLLPAANEEVQVTQYSHSLI
jgi:vacuolar protein sorting-associated protein 29